MMYNMKRSRQFDPTHPGIVWNRTLLFHQKPGRVWNSRAKNQYRLNRLQREKFVDKIVREALNNGAYRDYINQVTRAYGEWMLLQCSEDQIGDYMAANVRITEHELMTSHSSRQRVH